MKGEREKLKVESIKLKVEYRPAAWSPPPYGREGVRGRVIER